MGLFDGLQEAETFERGAFLQPGYHSLQLVRCLAKNTRKSGVGFIAEFEVLASTNPNHVPGSKATWFQKMLDKNVAFPALKSFLIGVLGLRSDDPALADVRFPDLAEWATSHANPLGGMVVSCNATMIKTVAKNEDFTRCDFEPFPFEGSPFPRPDIRDLMARCPAAGHAPVPYGSMTSGPGNPNAQHGAHSRPQAPPGAPYYSAGYVAPPPPPVQAMPWDLPGATLTPDRRFYLVNNQWQPIPGR